MGILKKRKGAVLSGKMGEIVFFWRRGKQLFRSRVVPHNPKTPAQTAHREKFGLASQIVSGLFDAMKHGHPDPAIGFGTLCGRVYHQAIIGEHPHLAVDYSKVQIAEGPLSPPRDVRLHWNRFTREVRITWNGALAADAEEGSPTDQASVVCQNNLFPRNVRTHLGGRRSTGETTFPLPVGWDHGLTHYWLYFTSHDGTQHSGSVYVVE